MLVLDTEPVTPGQNIPMGEITVASAVMTISWPGAFAPVPGKVFVRLALHPVLQVLTQLLIGLQLMVLPLDGINETVKFDAAIPAALFAITAAIC